MDDILTADADRSRPPRASSLRRPRDWAAERSTAASKTRDRELTQHTYPPTHAQQLEPTNTTGGPTYASDNVRH